MEPNSEAILAAAMLLPMEERFTLVSRLLEALPADEGPCVDDPALGEELDRRFEDRKDSYRGAGSIAAGGSAPRPPGFFKAWAPVSKGMRNVASRHAVAAVNCSLVLYRDRQRSVIGPGSAVGTPSVILDAPGETESGSAGTQPDKGYPGRRCAKGASGPRQLHCRGPHYLMPGVLSIARPRFARPQPNRTAWVPCPRRPNDLAHRRSIAAWACGESPGTQRGAQHAHAAHRRLIYRVHRAAWAWHPQEIHAKIHRKLR